MDFLSINWLNSQRCLEMQKTVCLIVFLTLTISQIWGLSTGKTPFAEQGYGYKLVYSSAVVLLYAELSAILILIKGVTKKSLSLLCWWCLIRSGFVFSRYFSAISYLILQGQNLETDAYVLTPFHVYFHYTWWLLLIFDMGCLLAHISELDPTKDEKCWSIFQRVKFSRLIFLECVLYIVPLSSYFFVDVYKLVSIVLEDSPRNRDPLFLFGYTVKTTHGFSTFPFLVILYKGIKQENLPKVILFYKWHVLLYIGGLLGVFIGEFDRTFSKVPGTFIILMFYYNINYGILNMLLLGPIIQLKHPHPQWFDLQINADTQNKMRQKFMNENKEFFKTCEISPRDLKLLDNVIIGEGQFSYVYKGLMFSPLHVCNHFSPRCLIQRIPEAVVAVKVLKSLEDPGYGQALLKELEVLQKIGQHDHIVRFHGCSVPNIKKEWSAVCLIMEYCDLGNLQEYLRTLIKPDDTGSVAPSSANLRHNMQNELLRIAFETSDGMSFLSQNKNVHADLASRNVLLDAKKRVKITDFGMSITLYHYQIYASSVAKVFPWKWMAPESLTDLKFSSKSDVWSFGVVLWEIFSFGQVPYPMLKWNSHFVQQMINGCRLQKPNLTGDEIYGIMLHCWELDPYRRPHFAELSLRLRLLSIKS